MDNRSTFPPRKPGEEDGEAAAIVKPLVLRSGGGARKTFPAEGVSRAATAVAGKTSSFKKSLYPQGTTASTRNQQARKRNRRGKENLSKELGKMGLQLEKGPTQGGAVKRPQRLFTKTQVLPNAKITAADARSVPEGYEAGQRQGWRLSLGECCHNQRSQGSKTPCRGKFPFPPVM